MVKPDRNRIRDPHTCVLKTLFQQPTQSSSSSTRTWQWATPQIEGSNPCARGGHTATLVQVGGGPKLVLFGGHYNNDGVYTNLNDVYVLDVDQNMWTTPVVKGTPPEPRYGHSASLVGSRVVFFGGRGDGGQHYRDLHALDVHAMTWYQGPSSGGAPAARMAHTSTLFGTNLLIFGGVSGPKFFSGLHVLDLTSMAWRTQETTGPAPSARMGHAAVLMETNLLIHGGFSLPANSVIEKTEVIGDVVQACYMNDFRVLNLHTWEWSRLRTHGVPLCPRFGHSIAASGTDLIAFGGWHGVDTTSWATRGKDKPMQPSGNEEQSNADCMILRTSDMTWSEVRYTGVAPCTRYFHSCTTIGPHLIVFGGYDGGKPLADLVVLRETSEGGK
mmetsp:Transcript_9225/g.22639  ORF Transcript_9225/g.22639 Transcript_9225/m.22639 type:complete len:386 (+) Transcript_9225:121-1278(+)